MPYSFNHTIKYDRRLGAMPFLSQTLYVSNVVTEYSPYDERVRFELESTIFPGDSLGCPDGFSMAESGAWCTDVDECKTAKELIY